ncbi:MAG: recombinase family protein [Chloroflexi bacterium]|nr:recombinase family protein [Chloroflexota bacterium]
MNAVIYVRVSTDEQVHGYSLQTQVEACRRYAAERGYRVVGEFKDDYTGASLDRPGLNQLRAYVASDTTGVVIVYDVDRLARKSVYQMLIEEELARAGATVEYVLGQYANTDEGRLQKQIRASIAEYEKAKILERSKRGKRGMAQSGFVLVAARPPYGYSVKSEPHKAWLVVVEAERQIVILVYRWYLYGDGQRGPYSIHGIATRLTELNVPTRGDQQKHIAKKRAAGVWSGGMIRHILTNETFTGVWHFGKTKVISDGNELTRQLKSKRGLGKQVARARDEWVAVEVPAIIDRETYDRVQERIKLNVEQSKRNTRREYLLAKRLRCAICGYTYVGITRREKHRYYKCNGAHQRPRVCSMPHFRGDLVDDAVWQWVKTTMQNPKSLTAGLRASQAETEQANQTLRERLSIVESQLHEKQNELKRLLDLYLSGNFPKEMLLERKQQLEQIVTDLERERADVSDHIQTVLVTEKQVAEIEEWCAQIREGLDNATFEDKRRYFTLLDVRGKLAIENNEKVVYIKCKIGKQRVSVAATSHSSNTGAIAITFAACR